MWTGLEVAMAMAMEMEMGTVTHWLGAITLSAITRRYAMTESLNHPAPVCHAKKYAIIRTLV